MTTFGNSILEREVVSFFGTAKGISRRVALNGGIVPLRLLGLLPAVLLLISTLLPASVLLRLLPSALLLGLVGLLVASSLGVAAALVAGVVRLAAEELHVVGEDCCRSGCGCGPR